MLDGIMTGLATALSLQNLIMVVAGNVIFRSKGSSS